MFAAHRRLKTKLIAAAPFIAVIFSVITAAVSLRLNLSKDVENFREEFIGQYSWHMSKGDISSLRRRLEALSVSYHVVCIEGQTKHSVFFRREKGSCADSILKKKIQISSNKNPSLIVSATLRIPRSHLVLAAVLIAVQMMLLVFLSRTAKLLEIESLQHELDKSRAFSALTTMLAHDARRPLAVTKMAVDLLRQVETLDQLEKLRGKIIPEIDQAAAGVEGLFLDVMELGRDEKNGFYRTKIVLHELIIEVVKTFSEKKVSVSMPNDILVLGNEFRLKRVFANIIENAIDAAGTDGTISISAVLMPGFAKINIANTGSFIALSEQSKIFELFYTKGKPLGTGLGLAISKKIVEGHGGSIQCRSSKDATQPTGLTEFFIFIPTYISQGTFSPDGPLLEQGIRPKVAVIDDSVIAAEAWLRALGSKVEARFYDSPDAFFEEMRSQPERLLDFQMVITDFYFEGSEYNGDDVFKFIFNLAEHVPVVLASSLATIPGCQEKFTVVVEKKPMDYQSLVHRLAVSGARTINRY